MNSGLKVVGLLVVIGMAVFFSVMQGYVDTNALIEGAFHAGKVVVFMLLTVSFLTIYFVLYMDWMYTIDLRFSRMAPSKMTRQRRNDICACGSSLNFKNCCERYDNEKVMQDFAVHLVGKIYPRVSKFFWPCLAIHKRFCGPSPTEKQVVRIYSKEAREALNEPVETTGMAGLVSAMMPRFDWRGADLPAIRATPE